MQWTITPRSIESMFVEIILPLSLSGSGALMFQREYFSHWSFVLVSRQMLPNSRTGTCSIAKFPPNNLGQHAIFFLQLSYSCLQLPNIGQCWFVHAAVDTPVMRWQVLLHLSSEGALPAASSTASSSAAHVFVIRAPHVMLFEVLGASPPDSGEMLQAPTEGLFLKVLGATSAVPGVLRAATWPVLLKVLRAPTQHVFGQHLRAAPRMRVPLLLRASLT